MFAPYWVDNRTGRDLFFKDYLSANRPAYLMGAKWPGSFAEVETPGKLSMKGQGQKTKISSNVNLKPGLSSAPPANMRGNSLA